MLLMFSGGLDSTGAFWQLLQKHESVHVYHMHLKNIENRTDAEADAVAKIMEWLKGQGHDFYYSESKHEYPAYNHSFIWDADIASFMAGTLCAAMPWIKRVAYGRTASDDEHSAVWTRIERANKIFQALCSANKIYPVQHLNKNEIYEMLPEGLRDLSWSCRRPVYKDGNFVPCNSCITCANVKRLRG